MHLHGIYCAAALVALVCAAFGASGAVDTDVESTGGNAVATSDDLSFRDCELSSYERSRRVDCATLPVPEDYDNTGGEQLSLRVVRLAARNGRGTETPLLAIAGGPGQAASEAFLYLDRMLPAVARKRDIYLVDQRGTGGSNPQHCELDDAALMQVEPDPEAIRASAQACLDQFDGNPEQYTTSVAIRDLEQVRRALGVPRWHLFGVSYGTRVVQHYMHRHPQVIRTAVLDSVVPANAALGPDIAMQSQRALDTFLARCADDDDCNRAFPDLAEGLDSLLTRLDAAPLDIRFEDIRTGGVRDMRFTRAHLVGVLRLALYQSEQLATLPPMLYQAYAQDNFTALARTADALAEELAETLAIGMHNAVVCTEDVPFFALDDRQREALAATYMGDLVVRVLEVTCDVWPRGRMDADLRTPVSADIPTLLLTGEADPITPPAYAEAVLAHLPHARHLVAPGQGHFVSPRGCIPGIIAQFIGTERVEGLETACLQRLRPTPLFVNFNGPTP